MIAEMFSELPWLFPANLKRVMEADKLRLLIDMGFHSCRSEKVLLAGVKTPSTRHGTVIEGELAKDFVVRWFAAIPVGEWPLVVRSFKSMNSDWYQVKLWRADTGACLNDDLVSSGHAIEWNDFYG